jgi:hypothetical protein
MVSQVNIWPERQAAYHAVAIFILKMSITITAVVFVVSCGLHVLVGRVLRGECTSASLTLKLGSPMLQVIHVLIARLITAEFTRARLALAPMIVIIHVLIAVRSIIEFVITSSAFPHLGK